MIKIYALTSYKINKAAFQKNCKEYDVETVCQKLEVDQGYDFRIHPKTNYIFFGDLDYYISSFGRFAVKLCYFLDHYYNIEVDIDDIKYTTNAGKMGSHHYSIPKIYCSCEKLNEIHTNLAKVNADLTYRQNSSNFFGVNYFKNISLIEIENKKENERKSQFIEDD